MTKRRLVAACALALGLWPITASAQVTPRGKPVIRTPNTPAAPKGPAGAPTPAKPADPGAPAPADPKQGTPAPGQAPAPGAPGAPGGAPAKDPKDPMSQLPQTAKEIEFRPKPGDYLVSFSLEDADLPDLVKAISQTTGKRFIYGSKLRSIKATVYSPEKVTAAEAYSAFLSILESNGMTVIPHGSFLKIVDTQDAVKQPAPVYGTAAPVPAEDRFVTRMYRLTNVDATEVAQILNTNFKSKDGNITTYAPGNLLIITDTGSNIRRMLRIVEELDVGSAGDQIWVQPVYNSSAADAAAKLNEILAGRGGAGGKAGGAAGGAAGNVIADERTNSLIITATKGDYDKILELVKRVVDAPMVEGDNQIHVLPLQHSKCADLQSSLSQILGGGGARPAGGAARAGAARPGGAAAGAAAGGAAGGEEVFEGAVKVGCDEATNSLLTTSSSRDYAALRAVVDKLDMPRRQVFIEAVIMDINVNRTTDLGLGYHGGGPFDTSEGQGVVYGGNNPLQSASGVPGQLSALALGVRGPDIDSSENILGTGISIPAFGVVLHALANDGDSNVLATPHILATDSVEATISVGQSVPLQTNAGALGTLASAAGAGAGAAGALGGLGGLGGLLGGQAPREDVGIKLSIKPYVNDSDQVRLELKEEISEVGATDQGTLGAVTINKRQAATTLIVRDQQTVVIGGLMRDQETTAETKVPILGDIPVLGFLFRQQVKTKAKSNLLLILTPYVVREQDDLRVIFERKMQERQEFLDRYFVFSEDMEWSPPRDFSRSNGLLEAIRQSMLEARERERLEEEARPRRPRTHDSVEPIALPSTAAAPGGKGGATGTAAAATTNPAPAADTTGAQRGKIKPPTTPPRPAGGQRVE
ncbi:MAG: type II secretion system secretin GspD [Myxococcales bacterium]|nr:type II secretion system secretin GspD [Myxococcales bacterium]